MTDNLTIQEFNSFFTYTMYDVMQGLYDFPPTEGAKILSERIRIVKCINQTLSKGYDRLTDRMSLQEGNMHAIKIMSKDETLSLLES